MALSDVARATLALLGPRRRRAWANTERAHVELRALTALELGSFELRLAKELARLDRVRWHRVDAHVGRVVVCFERGAYDVAEITAVVAEAERQAEVSRAGFDDARAEHPADVETQQRLLLELSADLLGLALGAFLKTSILPASSLAARTAAIASLVRATPRLRGGLDKKLGAHRADLSLGLLTPMMLGLAQRPGAALVEVAHKAALLREARSRHKLWHARERELCEAPRPEQGPPVAREPRPVPLPGGPIEDYADRAWVVSLSGFLVSFLTTRSIQRGFAALYGGLPRPARMGREVFAAELATALADRGVLVLDPSALRRLDRIDCLVLDGALIAVDRFELGRVVMGGAPELRPDSDEIRELTARLFDADRPLELKREADFVLGPPRKLEAGLDDGLAERVDELASTGALVVGVARRGEVVALVEVKLLPRTGVEELVQGARRSGLGVVIATRDDSLFEKLDADDTIPDGDGMAAGVLRLQREGRTVCVVASGASPALPVADLAIGIVKKGQPTPWGAHLVAESDLDDVRLLTEASAAARDVSRESVKVAIGAATLGALVSAGGLLELTTSRVLAVVNAATLVSMTNGFKTSWSVSRKALPAPRDRTPWHALEARGVVQRLGTDADRGLATSDVLARRVVRPRPKLAITELGEAISEELFNPLAPLLAAGAALSAVVGSSSDAAILGGVVLLNAMVGGVQRLRTERALRVLERSVHRRALVRREGATQDVEASALVRGDVVLLGPGDVVPADCRIVASEALEVDGSTLTGESLPVRKSARASFDDAIADRSSMLFEGQVIAAGSATAVVVAVGDETEARRGITAARRDRSPSGVELRLKQLVSQTGPVALGSAAAVVGAGLLRGRKLEDLIGSGVSLAVASVPEGLPLLATAAQLAAAERLSKRGALVRNPRCLEALGRVDVVCVDKTGTVTEGRIELSVVSDGELEEPASALSGPRLRALGVALRAGGETSAGAARIDPTDAALQRAASRLALRSDYGCEGWSRRAELAFEAGRAYHAALGAWRSGRRLAVKGAPELLLAHCTHHERGQRAELLDEARRAALGEQAQQLAKRGLRVIAVAEREVEPPGSVDAPLSGLTFKGFVAFSDPVRPAARAALARLAKAGVATVMITGDHPSTASAIAEQLELGRGRRVLSGAELGKLSDEELDRELPRVAVFARVAPAQKVRVVRALQRAGRTVAMVGDGANDAPAIRLADVGIAIGDHTAAARAAADIVLVDERIETIAEAVAEGRAVWASVRDAVSILVGGNFGEIGFTVLAGLLDGRPPLHPRQLLMVNLLTDVAPAMAIALKPPSKAQLESLAAEGPEASLGAPLTRDIAGRAAVTALGAGGAWIAGRLTGSAERARTIGLVALVGTQLGQTLVSGGLTVPVVLTSLGSLGLMGLVVQTPGVSQFFGCKPLGPVGWLTALGASAAATGAATLAPKAAEELYRRVTGREIVPDAPAPALGG